MNPKRASGVDTEIARRVYVHRKRLGLSQTELAQKLGITFQQVQKYEKGTNRIVAGRLFQLAVVFNIPIQTLFPPAEPRPPTEDDTAIDTDALADLLLTADGRRLYQAFLQLKDRIVRKRVIALVEALIDQHPS